MPERTIIKPISFVPIKEDYPRKEVAHLSLDLKFLKIDLTFNKRIRR